MKIPQHLFALTKPEQRVVLLIILGLLCVSAFNHYRKAELKVSPSVPTQTAPDSKAPADDQAEED